MSTQKKASKKASKPAKKAEKKCDGCCCAACNDQKKPAKDARKIDVDKVKETAKETIKKLPQWITWLISELEKLLDRINKVQAMIDTLAILVERGTATKEQKEELRLLQRQKRAMDAYADALKARKAKAGF